MPTLSNLLGTLYQGIQGVQGIQGTQGIQGLSGPTNVGLTANNKTSSHTLAAGDVGEYIGISAGGIIIPSNTFSAGDCFTIYNSSGVAQTVTQGAGTSLYVAGTATTGNVSMAGTSILTVLCVSSNTFVVVGVEAGQQDQLSIVTDSLVLWLDAGNTASYPGSGTTWTNLISGGNNGTLVNGVGYNSGNLGSLVFDGSNDYVNAPITKTATCTFSCWAKTTSLASSPMLFNAGVDGGGPDLFFSSGSISWNTWDSSSNSFASIPASVTDGNWHNYVVVNDASSNAKLYYDGSLLGTASYRNASTNTNLTIGGNTNTYMWNGNIATFYVHNKVLSEAEITQNYDALKSRFGIS